MRPRHRITKRRRADSPAPMPPTPDDLTTEIERSAEARDKLRATLLRFDAQRGEAKPAFLRGLAGSLPSGEIDPNDAQARLAAWNAEEARAAEQRGALQQLLSMFQDRVTQFSSASPAETAQALQRLLPRLEQMRDQPGADHAAISSRIAELGKEMASLQATPRPAQPRGVKDKSRESVERAPAKASVKEKRQSRKSAG